MIVCLFGSYICLMFYCRHFGLGRLWCSFNRGNRGSEIVKLIIVKYACLFLISYLFSSSGFANNLEAKYRSGALASKAKWKFTNPLPQPNVYFVQRPRQLRRVLLKIPCPSTAAASLALA